MDLITARTEVKARGFDYLPDSRVDRFLNNAKNALEDWFVDCPWLETTAATGAAPLTVSDLHSVIYVLDTTTSLPLEGVDARDIVDLDGNVSTAGYSRYWWLDGLTTIRTYPVNASDQISVRYRKYSPELSANTDTPSIPVRYHPVWVDFAVVEALKDDDQYGEAQQLLGFINTRLQEMQDTFTLRNRQNTQTQVIVHGSEDW